MIEDNLATQNNDVEFSVTDRNFIMMFLGIMVCCIGLICFVVEDKVEAITIPPAVMWSITMGGLGLLFTGVCKSLFHGGHCPQNSPPKLMTFD